MSRPGFEWIHATEFYDRVERLNLHGLHFQHMELCQRRAWMYLHGVNFAQWYSRVSMGTARHESSFNRDRSVKGLQGLSPDRIDWKNNIVIEDKGSAGAVEASTQQTAFYALMLAIRTGQEWSAKVHVLGTQKNWDIELNQDRLVKLNARSVELQALNEASTPPHAQKIRLCQACSLADFCGFR